MPGRLGSFLVAASTALVILAASIVPFANPVYVRFEQDRTGVAATTGFSAQELDAAANVILGDLFAWQGNFDNVLGSDHSPLFSDRDVAHMLDVRGVFLGFELLVVAAVVVLIAAFARAGAAARRARFWRAAARGARGLVMALVVVGFFAVFAFDAAFEVFHRLLFPAGSYDFDPRTDHLVQLFPEQFWSETAIAVGIVAMTAAVATVLIAGRRARGAMPTAVLTTSRAGS